MQVVQSLFGGNKLAKAQQQALAQERADATSRSAREEARYQEQKAQADADRAAEKSLQDEQTRVQSEQQQSEEAARAEQEAAANTRRAIRAKGGRRGILTFLETGSSGLSSFLGGGR